MEEEQPLLPVPPLTTDLANLDPERLRYIENFLVTVLASSVAENTFAQVIDGLPTRSSFEKNTGTRPWRHEVLKRDKPTESSLKLFREFRARFQLAGLLINSKIVQLYQNTPISSGQFYLRLFEVVALAIHSLGGSMYISSHPNANIRPREYDYTQHPHYPVDLYHKLYLGYSFYPYGLLDTVGYWTETQIFGGVVLFEHEQSGSKILNVFIHTQSLNAFQLSSQQLDEISQLCEAWPKDATERAASFFPIQADSSPRTLNCNEFYAANIFRDEFSRLYPQTTFTRPQCVVPMTDEMRGLIKWANEQLDARPATEPDSEADSSHFAGKSPSNTWNS